MRAIFATFILMCLFAGGCDSLRFAPSESQKQNAWLHNRTALMVADTAKAENASDNLQALAQLSELQSRGFSSYFGLPQEFPTAATAEEILSESNLQLAQVALTESYERPDAFELTDNIFELAIAVSGLVGGIYGTRAVKFLKQARSKSKALQEIIAGNELFKKEHKAYAAAFKEAHKSQSPQTRQIVAEMKAH